MNPPGDYAARLIEKSGLKGTRIGGAEISALHANFIVNNGGARASDILSLIALARERVKETAGIDLETEIKVVGEDLPGGGNE
jgi:UDP-N-acetylmuramate dehydrogenase